MTISLLKMRWMRRIFSIRVIFSILRMRPLERQRLFWRKNSSSRYGNARLSSVLYCVSFSRIAYFNHESIDELRKAYLRDVVAVKYIVDEVLTNTEKRAFFDQWKDTVPSVDLKDALVLRSPYHGALNVAPCRRCGGTVNVLFSETQKVKDLTARVETLSTRNELLRLMIATQEAQSEKVSTELAETKTSHFEEKKFLYAEVKRLKEEIEEAAIKSRQAAAANKRMKQESLKQISAHEDLTIRALANEKALERAIEMNTEQKQVIQDLKESIRGYQSGYFHQQYAQCTLLIV